MTYDEFKQNFLPEFLNIKSFKGKIDYANQRLAKIGSGTGRVVYDIDGEKVLKLAKNPKGIAQNEAEAGAGYYRDTHDIVAIIYESGDNDEWLISEKGKKVNEKRIKELTGIPGLNELSMYLRNFHSSNNGRGNIFGQDREVIDELNENEFAQDLQNFIANYGQSPGDMGRPSTYGEVLREGQPTIVLTDYGLNDEVYDTHYNPARKRGYRMYEMYNFADGNDDMLSDMTDADGNDTRHAMWALMPYGVGDGDGVINEDFISFVLNRDKYPTRTLPSTPYILDEFHDIVNNLKEVLDHVSDKKKFYNNLLELQDYLIRGKFYDREPLEKGMVALNEEVLDEEVKRDVADSIANQVAEKFNFGTPKYLGSGSNGVAYDINNKLVLKITGDRSEANENLELIGKPLKYIAQPYKVFSIKSASTEKELYVIILEKLKTDKAKFQAIKDRLDFAFEKIMDVTLGDVLDYYLHGFANGVDEDKIQKYMSRNPGDAEYFNGLLKIMEEVKKYGIESMDYVNPTNLGYKPDGSLGFFDVGFGNYYFKSENQPEDIDVNEDGSALYSTDNSFGQDNFPPHNNIDTSPSIQNDLNANSAIDEDLEYNHVVGDATQDVYELSERKLSYMPGSQSVEVKKKCRLAGNGNTSTACNQGDINNLNIKPINENDDKLENIRQYLINYFDLNNVVEPASLPIKDGNVRLYHQTDKDNFDNIKGDGSIKLNRSTGKEFSEPTAIWGKVVNAGDNGFYGSPKERYTIEYQIPRNEVDAGRVSRDVESDEILAYHDPTLFKVKEYVLDDDYLKSISDNPEHFLEYGKYQNGAEYAAFLIASAIVNKQSKPIDESINLDIPRKLSGYDSLKIMNDGQVVGEVGIVDRGIQGGNHYIAIDKIFIDEQFRGNDYANDAMKLIFYYADNNNLIITLTPDSVWGANKSKLKAWYKSLGFVENKGRNKDFQTMQLMYRLPKNGLNEEINAKDLYGDATDSIALKTVINGKRDVCFIELNPSNVNLVEKNHLGVFPVRMTSHKTMMALVYRDRLKALKLYKIAIERGGYLNDRTPDEAREIGQLLGYKEASIEEYIRRNQHRYGRQIPRAPEPEDFNDMDESIEGAGDKYYRAIEKYMGETIEFEPEGFYEAIDDNGNPIYKYDTFWVSETPEVAASKSVGGALMGLYSMFMQHSKNPGVFYVYEITEKPDVDISHWEIGDFTYLQEVRYRRPVRGSYVGKVDITDDFKKRMNAFYEINGLEAYDEPDEETSEIFQDTDYEQYLDKMKDTVHEQETLDVSEKNTIFEAENFSNDVLDKEYPIINGNEIEGLLIRSQIPNMGSIEASLTNYEILDGIRQVSFASFTQMENLSYYSPDEERKTKELAEQIKYNKEINPLIVVVDDEGPYVLEGGHRFDALRELNIPSFPAKVVIDLDSANIDENVINEAEIMSLQNLPFKQEVERLGGKIFSVGGAVRDEFLGKQSKDLDVLISGIPMNELEQLLSKYGRVDAVGKSFGVLKFKPKGATEEIDIAIPRTEKPTGDAGHKAFDVTSDHALPIEKDLERRDFTINAIAKDTDGNIVDPFNGQEDLKNKIIRIVNPQAFSDDPLRMLRAVQFASRFGFEIEPETMKMIQDNAGRVKEIAPERILTEFDKIIKKGDILTGVELLINTGLFAQIFGNDLKPSMIGRRDFANVRTMGEFIFLMTNGIMENPAAFYKTNLKGDIDTFKEIKALEMAFDSGEATSLIEARSVAHNMYVTSPQSLESQILPNVVKSAAQELLQGKYPKTVNELAVNGNDLTGIGLQGKAIGDMQKSLLLKVYANKVRNNREDLLNLTGQNNVKEGVGSKYAVKFGIPDTNADVKAMADVQTELETPYGYITGKDDKGNRFKIPVFKNPKSLTNFDKNARAIGDAEGNLYVAQENGWFNHGTMAFSLRLARTNMDIYDNDEDFVLLHRNGESNGFGLSDSTAEYAGRNYDNLENTKYILRALKEKNPQYDFYKIYFGSITELYMNAGVGTSKSLDELYQQQNIAYTAVVLDEKSRSRLLERFSSMIPDGWETIAHHMTINMGEIDPEYQKFLGLSVRLTVEDVAIDDKVMAVGVSGFDSRNAKAHITIAVNRQEGGKPMMSNNLTDWKKIQKPLLITGKITEVKYK